MNDYAFWKPVIKANGSVNLLHFLTRYIRLEPQKNGLEGEMVSHKILDV